LKNNNGVNKDMRFTGKTAIVTGAASGIGRAAALQFAREGANVAAIDIDRGKIEKLAEVIRSAGGVALPLVVDIVKNEEVKAAVAEVLAEFNQFDILVNSAGAGWHKPMPFKDIPDGSWEWILDLNIKGTLYFTRAVVAHMAGRKYGKIINISSIAASVGIPGLAVYSASKGAIVSFTKALAMELGPLQINVNCVSPGLVAREEEPLEPCRGTFLGRKGKADEIATLIAFLASDEASFITGVDYVIDGGRILGPRGA